ncbi:MAG: ribonuclease HI family protein [Candidatus Omnitrophica bacterium]|nr:ribonuclease HI family protein [Candidatus Omnitrophota bacterium]
MSYLEIYIDGASKGNPGHSGIGIVIYRNGQILKRISSYIGKATNNIAEYTALICALEEALLLKAKNLEINTDSQLLARQISGVYKVRNEGLKCLHERAVRLLSGFEKALVNHIPREKNSFADRLATGAVKAIIKNSPSGFR